MKQFVIISIFVLFLGCVSTPKLVTQSYHATVSIDQSEIAWARAHAYIQKVFRAKNFQHLFNINQNFKSGKYYIIAGNLYVTREYTKTSMIIRATMSSSIEIEGPESINKDRIERRKNSIREKILQFLAYTQTGESELMRAEEI